MLSPRSLTSRYVLPLIENIQYLYKYFLVVEVYGKIKSESYNVKHLPNYNTLHMILFSRRWKTESVQSNVITFVIWNLTYKSNRISQKQPFSVALKNLEDSQQNICARVRVKFLITLQARDSGKKKLRHWHFHVSFMKSLRTSFWKNFRLWLVLSHFHFSTSWRNMQVKSGIFEGRGGFCKLGHKFLVVLKIKVNCKH